MIAAAPSSAVTLPAIQPITAAGELVSATDLLLTLKSTATGPVKAAVDFITATVRLLIALSATTMPHTMAADYSAVTAQSSTALSGSIPQILQDSSFTFALSRPTAASRAGPEASVISIPNHILSSRDTGTLTIHPVTAATISGSRATIISNQKQADYACPSITVWTRPVTDLLI